MKKSTIITLSVIGGILLLIIIGIVWGVGARNSMVRESNEVDKVWGNVQTEYQRRMDLIPNLVATVKGYATHERELLERVTAARTAAMSAVGINDKIQTENALSSALSGLRVSLEAYPDLKANQNFLQLQEEVSDLENKLAASRRFFNGATRDLNTAIETFPACLFAGMFGFHREPMFEIPAADRATLDKAPEIKF